MAKHIPFIIFFFIIGACVGSFLNVVVWRLPRGESLVLPPSRCPKCEHRLAWRDNIPVFGWLFLRGKCRYCANPISPRYPIVEATAGLLFAGYYVAFFILQRGPCSTPPVALSIQQHWPIYLLYMFLVACLLAASLIDAELFLVPPAIPWWAGGVGLVVHAIIDSPGMPGALNASPASAALALGAGIGLIISIALLSFGILPMSFADGAPELEIDKKRRTESGSNEPPPKEFTRAQVRAEMRKEMLFLMPPLVLGGAFALLAVNLPAISSFWSGLITHNDWLSGFLGALLGGLVGGFCIWFTRIIASICFGREAMGLGDVDLMFGVGAILGPGAAVVAFFLAPFCGMGVTVYKLIFKQGHELAFVPYLSMGSGLAMLFYCPIAAHFTPGLEFMVWKLREAIGL